MKIKYLVIWLLVSATLTFGQTSKEMFALYQQNNFQVLRSKLELAKKNLSQPEAQFFQTLFEPDGELAFQAYKSLFENASGQVKYYCGERLKDYFYAKGYYSTSSDYEKYLVENRFLIEEKEVSFTKYSEDEEPDEEQLFIQVGAFGLKANANQMSEMLQTQKVQSKIITRIVSGNKLYCVWVYGKKDFQETILYADELKKKYHLDYKIIKE